MAMYNKILLALDFGDSVEQLCQKTVELGQIHNSSVNVIHVVEPVISDSIFDTMPATPLDFEGIVTEQAQAELKRIAEKYSFNDEQIKLAVGITKSEIISYAEEIGADLIIVGSHERHGLAILLGSTSNTIVKNAPCDVLALRVK